MNIIGYISSYTRHTYHYIPDAYGSSVLAHPNECPTVTRKIHNLLRELRNPHVQRRFIDPLYSLYFHFPLSYPNIDHVRQ